MRHFRGARLAIRAICTANRAPPARCADALKRLWCAPSPWITYDVKSSTRLGCVTAQENPRVSIDGGTLRGTPIVMGRARSVVSCSALALFAVTLAACSGASEADREDKSAPLPERSGGGADPPGGTGGAEGSGGPTGPNAPPGKAPLTKLGSLVVLGDSIGDGGGVGPFYYARLHEMLAAKYGDVAFERRAESGSKTEALLGQAKALPATLPGPVAVAITSGGNDMKAQLKAVVFGADGPARAQMGENIGRALDELLAPGRFGQGVAVRVFEGNIYDASDGKGDYGANDCAFGNGVPAMPTDGYFTAWNDAIAGAAKARAQAVVDMHQIFRGHGYASPPSWYHTDCTHPSTTGHEELAKHFYEAITSAAF
jgi:lysophospholipase L1-like esterase